MKFHIFSHISIIRSQIYLSILAPYLDILCYAHDYLSWWITFAFYRYLMQCLPVPERVYSTTRIYVKPIYVVNIFPNVLIGWQHSQHAIKSPGMKPFFLANMAIPMNYFSATCPGITYIQNDSDKTKTLHECSDSFASHAVGWYPTMIYFIHVKMMLYEFGSLYDKTICCSAVR